MHNLALKKHISTTETAFRHTGALQYLCLLTFYALLTHAKDRK